MVEFAIISVLLFLVLFGAIDFGLLLYNKQVITNASREGARRGIVQNSPRIPVSEINTVVQTYCQNHLINFATNVFPTITVSNHSGTPGTICGDLFGIDNELSVTVQYNYKFLALPNVIKAAGGSFSDPITLVSSTVMKCE